MELKSSLITQVDKISSEILEDLVLNHLSEMMDEKGNFNLKLLLEIVQIRYPQLNNFFLISLIAMIIGFSIYNNDYYCLCLSIILISSYIILKNMNYNLLTFKNNILLIGSVIAVTITGSKYTLIFIFCSEVVLNIINTKSLLYFILRCLTFTLLFFISSIFYFRNAFEIKFFFSILIFLIVSTYIFIRALKVMKQIQNYFDKEIKFNKSLVNGSSDLILITDFNLMMLINENKLRSFLQYPKYPLMKRFGDYVYSKEKEKLNNTMKLFSEKQLLDLHLYLKSPKFQERKLIFLSNKDKYEYKREMLADKMLFYCYLKIYYIFSRNDICILGINISDESEIKLKKIISKLIQYQDFPILELSKLEGINKYRSLMVNKLSSQIFIKEKSSINSFRLSTLIIWIIDICIFEAMKKKIIIKYTTDRDFLIKGNINILSNLIFSTLMLQISLIESGKIHLYSKTVEIFPSSYRIEFIFESEPPIGYLFSSVDNYINIKSYKKLYQANISLNSMSQKYLYMFLFQKIISQKEFEANFLLNNANSKLIMYMQFTRETDSKNLKEIDVRIKEMSIPNIKTCYFSSEFHIESLLNEKVEIKFPRPPFYENGYNMEEELKNNRNLKIGKIRKPSLKFRKTILHSKSPQIKSQFAQKSEDNLPFQIKIKNRTNIICTDNEMKYDKKLVDQFNDMLRIRPVMNSIPNKILYSSYLKFKKKFESDPFFTLKKFCIRNELKVGEIDDEIYNSQLLERPIQKGSYELPSPKILNIDNASKNCHIIQSDILPERRLLQKNRNNSENKLHLKTNNRKRDRKLTYNPSLFKKEEKKSMQCLSCKKIKVDSPIENVSKNIKEECYLILESDKSLIKSLQNCFKFFKKKYKIEANGIDAINSYQNLILNKLFCPIVFLDLSAEILNGYESAKAIRNLEKIFTHPPVFLCAMSKEKITSQILEDCRQYDIDECLQKPLLIKTLGNLLTTISYKLKYHPSN